MVETDTPTLNSPLSRQQLRLSHNVLWDPKDNQPQP